MGSKWGAMDVFPRAQAATTKKNYPLMHFHGEFILFTFFLKTQSVGKISVLFLILTRKTLKFIDVLSLGVKEKLVEP